MQKCSVLISTCDKYKDAWDPFFFFFTKFWDDCPYEVYVNTESETYSNDDIKVNVLNCTKKNATWSQRLKRALKEIETEYVIFLLEDFFLLDNVNQNAINECVELMDTYKEISVIDFESVGNMVQGEKYKGISGFCKRDVKSMYFLNCQASIWRRKDLMRFLSPHESPWQFEIFGSERVKLYNKVFLLQEKNCCNVFEYNVNWDSGYGIHGGKWLRSNVDFFNKNGIEVDFTNMGFYEKTHGENVCPPPKVTLKYRIMYLLLSGGYIAPRLSVFEQLKLFFKSPRESFGLIKYKFKKCLNKNFFNN